MLNIVRQYAPNTWTSSDHSDVGSYSEEYRQVTNELGRAFNGQSPTVRRVIRIQDLHAYGQFLIREQLLINANANQQLFRVRRYIQVNKLCLNEVMKYNLDPRRCGMGQTLTVSNRISNTMHSKLIVVVKVLTTQPFSDNITPSTSCDYYVEYIVEID